MVFGGCRTSSCATCTVSNHRTITARSRQEEAIRIVLHPLHKATLCARPVRDLETGHSGQIGVRADDSTLAQCAGDGRNHHVEQVASHSHMLRSLSAFSQNVFSSNAFCAWRAACHSASSAAVICKG